MLYLLVGRLPVSPEEIFLLLSDFRKWVSVTQLSQLICVTLCQGVISGNSIALKTQHIDILKRLHNYLTKTTVINLLAVKSKYKSLPTLPL